MSISNSKSGPIPMKQLKPAPILEPSQEYTPNSEGKMIIKNRPSCLSIAFMLPYPFFCFGCCTSVSCDMIFDDNTQTITIKKWHGYLSFFKMTSEVIEYGSVGNIGYQRSRIRSNGSYLYHPIIVLKDGTTFYIGDAGNVNHLAAQVLALHKFIFGRNHNAKDYKAPENEELMITDPTAPCCCI